MEADNPMCRWSGQTVALRSPEPTNLLKVASRGIVSGFIANKPWRLKTCAWEAADRISVKDSRGLGKPFIRKKPGDGLPF